MNDKEHIAELTAIACGKRSKEDQALWDSVAKDIHRDIVNTLAQYAANGGDVEDSAKFDSAKDAFDFADAFMAERAKRMK